MPYSEPFVQLRLLGSFGPVGGTPTETWACGIKLRNPGTAPSPSQLTDFLAACEDPVESFHANSGYSIGSNVFLQSMTCAYIGTDGKYVGGANQQTTIRVTGPTPGVGTTTYPWTQCLVISLRTTLTRGPGSNGRIYYPMTAAGVAGSDGRIDGALAQTWATGAKTMLDGINDAADTHLPGTGGVSVMSNVGSGVAATVVAVRVGRRLDRQERREKSLSEDYRYSTLAAAAALGRPGALLPIGTALPTP